MINVLNFLDLDIDQAISELCLKKQHGNYDSSSDGMLNIVIYYPLRMNVSFEKEKKKKQEKRKRIAARKSSWFEELYRA